MRAQRLAVERDLVAGEHAAHRGHRFAHARQWLGERQAVPVLDDRMTGRTEAENEAPRRQLRHRAGRGGDGRRRADVDRRDGQSDADPSGDLRHRAGEHERIGAAGLRDPDAFVAEILGPAGPLDAGCDVAWDGKTERQLAEVHRISFWSAGACSRFGVGGVVWVRPLGPATPKRRQAAALQSEYRFSLDFSTPPPYESRT
jgi:hypothetical protein